MKNIVRRTIKLLQPFYPHKILQQKSKYRKIKLIDSTEKIYMYNYLFLHLFSTLSPVVLQADNCYDW